MKHVWLFGLLTNSKPSFIHRIDIFLVFEPPQYNLQNIPPASFVPDALIKIFDSKMSLDLELGCCWHVIVGQDFSADILYEVSSRHLTSLTAAKHPKMERMMMRLEMTMMMWAVSE